MMILSFAALLLASASTPQSPKGGGLEHAGGTPLTLEQHQLALAALGAAAGPGDRVAWPRTVAEASGWSRSSRLDEVARFLDELAALPAAARLERRVLGRTGEGRELLAVTVRAPEPAPENDPRAHVVVNANIHGGEIEGKVAVQILLRELALGYHSDILGNLVVTFVPVYNADGNDRIARTNRVSQNGPDGGVGARPNAADLDLNRDFVKLESQEAAALTRLLNELRPIAFMDLHTTNGSDHGYDLTYAPSLSPNAAPTLDEYARKTLLPGVRAVLRDEHAIETFDYGNFGYAPREAGSRGERGDPVRWETYDSRPRFGTNLMGLRDCVGILSEAYSYLPYERRTQATYAFTLECLRALARDKHAIRTAIAGAEASRARAAASDSLEPRGRDAEGVAPGGWALAVDGQLAAGPTVPLLLRRVDTVIVDLDPEEAGVQEGRRRVAGPLDTVRQIEVEARVAFSAGRRVDPGAAWVIAEPSDEVLRVLELHLGRAPKRLQAPVAAKLDVFVTTSAERARRPFQGHRETTLAGSWEPREVTCPVGAVLVRSSPLTAHLLHPESDDSLTTWNFFDRELFPSIDGTTGAGAAEGPGRVVHPAWRIPSRELPRFDP